MKRGVITFLFLFSPALALGAELSEAEQAVAQGLQLQEAGRLEEAARAYRRAIRLDPRRPLAYARLRETYGKRETEALMKTLQEAVARDERDFISWNLLGVLYAKKRMWKEALAAFQKTLQIQPEDVDARANLGWVFSELKRYEEAKKEFLEALRLAPGYARAHAGLGGLYAGAQRDDRAAIAEYLKALEIEPSNAAYLNDLAWVYYRSGRLDDAIASFRRAIALRPDHLMARANLGWAYLKKGKPEEAVVQFEQVIALDRDASFALFGLGKALQALGKEAEASSAYKKAWRASGNDLYLLYAVGASLKQRVWMVLAAGGATFLVILVFLIRAFRRAFRQAAL